MTYRSLTGAKIHAHEKKYDENQQLQQQNHDIQRIDKKKKKGGKKVARSKGCHAVIWRRHTITETASAGTPAPLILQDRAH